MSDWQWNNGPLSEGDDIQSWEVFRQFSAAIDERWAVVNNQKERCCGSWPRSQVVWGQGIISAITATTLTPDEMPEKCGGVNAVDHNWTSGCAGINAVPSSWDIVVDDCDPTKVVRAHVVSNNDTTFTISDISDYATAKFIASLSSLVGKTFYLIKHDGPWWSERWMQWPNDWEYARGTVSSATTSSLTVDQKSWAGDLTGKDLLVFAGGRLRRVSVSSNAADTISFATQTWTPSGTFIVVAAGGRGDPNRQSDYCYRWDSSPQRGYYTHYPDDSTASANTPPATGLPSNTVKWQEGETTCEEVDCKSFEVDCWSALANECSEADKAYNRDLYRTVRGIALGAFELSGNFIDAQTGVPFTVASWFYRAGVNATKVTSTGRDGDNNLLVTLLPPFEPIEIYYAVLGKSGCATSDQIEEILTSGKGYYQDGKIIGDFNNVLYDTPREVVVTYGLSQPIEREFRWRGERRVFVPEQQANAINCGDEAPSAADPPNIANFDLCGCLGVGGYELRGKSTHYCEPYTGNAGGASNPNGKIIEGPDEFQVGDRARWIGDNWNDPAIPGPIQASSPTPFTTIYYDRMVEMRHQPQTQAQLIAQLRGVAASGTNHSLTVEDQDWWNEFWYPKGSGRVETGTFTGGSTTGGTDATKGASYEIVGYDEETFEPIYGWVPTEAGCWWSMSRFLLDGSASAYEYFIIEILISGVWHKRVIRATTLDDGGVTVSWNEPLPASANGKQYRIREAIGYIVHRFRGRTATLTEPDGVTTHEVTIIASDDKSLFWDAAGFTVAADWSYSIDDPTIDPAPGGVYEWDGSDWQLVEGAVPDRVMRYGIWPNLLLKGTVIGLHTLNELYALINVLADTYKEVTISSRADDEVAEFNSKTVGFLLHSCGAVSGDCLAQWDECWENVLDAITCGWADAGGTICTGQPCSFYSFGYEEESALPMAEWAGNVSQCETMNGITAKRRYCYVSVANISTCRPVQVEIWGKAQVWFGWECPSQSPAPYDDGCGTNHPALIEFDTNGDGDFGWGQWEQITTLTEIGDDGTTVRYRVGDNTLPLPAEPPTPCDPNPIGTGEEEGDNPCGYVETYRGYRMTGIKAILRWCFNYHAPGEINCAA